MNRNLVPQLSSLHRCLRLLSLLGVLLGGVALGCASTPYLWAHEIPPERAQPEAERKTIGRGDVVSLRVVGQEEMSGTQTVGADGTIDIALVGAMQVSGLTVKQAEVAVKRRLLKVLQKPEVSILVVTRFFEVSLLGEIVSPGKYSLQSGDGVAQAIAQAGGLTEFANKNSIYLVRKTEQYRIRFRMKDLLQGGASASAFALRDGDILVVE